MLWSPSGGHANGATQGRGAERPPVGGARRQGEVLLVSVALLSLLLFASRTAQAQEDSEGTEEPVEKEKTNEQY